LGLGTNVAVVVADISGSTSLYESVGNAEALTQIDGCLELLRQIIWTYEGHFIHSKGDDVLCVFNDPQNALDAVISMLDKTGGSALQLHAGIDFGQVILSRGDVFGDCVNVTSRLADLANSGEVLCSQQLFEVLDEAGRSKLRFFESLQFKGKADESRVYAYSGATLGQQTQIFLTDLPKVEDIPEETVAEQNFGVELCIGGRMVHSFQTGIIKLGRAEDCDLVVPKAWVSRYHAALEIRQNHLYLRDTSSNGTYICIKGQIPILARREVVLLPNLCELSLTKEPNDGEAVLIHCAVHLPRYSTV